MSLACACHLLMSHAYIIHTYVYVLQELENKLAGVQENHVDEWSFTIKENEFSMGELITYNDMESVTKELKEEHGKNIEVSGLCICMYV